MDFLGEGVGRERVRDLTKHFGGCFGFLVVDGGRRKGTKKGEREK